jgi:hypothetical protein
MACDRARKSCWNSLTNLPMTRSIITLPWVCGFSSGLNPIAHLENFLLVLDPRYKDTLFRANSSLLEELFSKDWVSDCADTLAETCEEFYSHHIPLMPIESQPIKFETTEVDDFDLAFEASVPRRSRQYPGSPSLSKEISEYLSEDVIGNTSPLTWWRDNAARFPRLAAMARDFLCIPGTFN